MTQGVFAKEDVKKADVRLVIDVSGSMKKNDPNDLRQPAVDLLVRLLPDGSKAGVWTFGKYVNMLIPHREVDEAWRNMARTKAKEINSVGLFTNIGGALEKAAHDRRKPNDQFNTSVILLTDGMVDVSKSPEDNQKEWRRIVDQVLPDLKNANFTIHTVALSENADTNLLEKIAVSTDGTSAIAYNAEDLMKIFLKAFDVAAPSQQVPLEGNSFAVDSSVEEFTALIFRVDINESTKLMGPDKEIYDSHTTNQDVSWLRTERYDLITVKRPVEGEWTVQANIDPDSRITIVSDMRLRVKMLPNNTFKGAKGTLSFVLQEEGKTITRPDFLSLLTNTINMAYGPSGTPTNQIWTHEFDRLVMPATGVFNVALPELKRLGVYDIAVMVDGKTFKRTFNHRITVREPFTASLEQGLNENGVEQYMLRVRSHSDSADIKQTQVVSTMTNPKRRRSVKPLGFTEFDYWQTVVDTDIPGEYSIKVKVTGKDKNGDEFEYALDSLSLNYDPNGAFEESPAPIVEAAVEVELEPESAVAAAPTQPVAVEEPELGPEVVPEANATEGGFLHSIPQWLIYVGLALGNLLILGGGYFLFKKLSSGGEDVLDDLADDSPVKEPPLETFEESAPDPEPEKESEPMAMKMDEADNDDEAPPPMEDLDVALDASEDDAVDVEKASEVMDETPVSADEAEDDFGVDDIEDDLLDPDDVDDVESEMRKKNGLDLADEELDDAINNLIDDLDESRDIDKDADDDLDDLEGIDFDDEK